MSDRLRAQSGTSRHPVGLADLVDPSSRTTDRPQTPVSPHPLPFGPPRKRHHGHPRELFSPDSRPNRRFSPTSPFSPAPLPPRSTHRGEPRRRRPCDLGTRSLRFGSPPRTPAFPSPASPVCTPLLAPDALVTAPDGPPPRPGPRSRPQATGDATQRRAPPRLPLPPASVRPLPSSLPSHPPRAHSRIARCARLFSFSVSVLYLYLYLGRYTALHCVTSCFCLC